MRKVALNTNVNANIGVTFNDPDGLWQAFDAMPKSVRQAIANAPLEYDTVEILEHFNQATKAFFGGLSVHEFVQDMEYNFRCDVQQSSYSGVERDYKFRRPKNPRRTVSRAAERKRGRQRSIFS